MDDILNKVYKALPKLPEESSPDYQEKLADYNKRKALKLWYADTYLPGVVGNQLSPAIRHAAHICEKTEICGKDRIIVESVTEGYGLFLLENGKSKMLATAKALTEDSKWTQPTYDKDDTSTHQYHKCKFTSSYGGQGKGLNKSGRDFLDQMTEKIKEIRKKDAKRKFKRHIELLDLMKVAHKKVSSDKPETRSGKKRKTEEDDFDYETFIGKNGKKVKVQVESDSELEEGDPNAPVEDSEEDGDDEEKDEEEDDDSEDED